MFCVLDSGCRLRRYPCRNSMSPSLEPSSELWLNHSVKQLAAILGLYAATFFLFDATASPACLVAATALPVAFGGVALHGCCPVGSSGSCFQHVPMGAAMLSAAMLRLCSCARGFAQ